MLALPDKIVFCQAGPFLFFKKANFSCYNELMENIEVIARAVVIKNNKILLCKAKNKPHYYFPGGHVEFGEKAQIALAREFQEEIGVNISNLKFIGIAEGVYTDEKGVIHHEINLTFEGQIKEKEIFSQEAHLEFSWIELEKIPETLIKPLDLIGAISRWLSDRKIFWSSEIE